MKQTILCFLTKEFIFSCLLTGEKSKSKKLEEQTYWTYKSIFESTEFMKPVSINSSTICLRPSEILWKVLETKVADFLTWALLFFILTFYITFPVISFTLHVNS